VFAVAACLAPLPVEKLLILASLVGSVMLLAPRAGLLAAVVLAATKRTAEIPPMRVPRMRQEANPAMAAEDRTACQTGMIAQDGIKRELILTDKRISAVVAVPIRPRRKEFPDGDDKNARFSVKMLSVVCISSSYSLDAMAARCRAGIFHAFTPNPEQRTGTTAGRDTNSQPRLGSR
jgi:hypothetical protein